MKNLNRKALMNRERNKANEATAFSYCFNNYFYDFPLDT